MNIAKLQAQLQKVPEQALIGYVQDPDGQVPSFLALAELTRRKEIRKSSAPQQGPAPTQTVAQQAVAEVGPGVSGLPIPDDMYSEQSMAAGGIVAFEDGGEVKRFDGLSGSDVNAPDFSTPKSSALGRWWESIAPTPYQGIGLDNQRKLMELMDERSKLSMGLFGRGRTIFTQENSAERKAAESKLAELDKQIQSIQGSAGAAGKGGYEPSAAEKAVTKNNLTPYVSPVTDTKAKPDQRPPAPSVDGANTSGIGALGYNQLKYKPYQVDEAGFDAISPKERAMRDYAAEFKAELGDDPNRAKLRERLAGMQAKAEKEEAQAPWMALANAGFEMASSGIDPRTGRRLSVLETIGKGGMRGVSELAAAKDRLLKAEERRFDIESKLAQSERADQLTALNYGAESKRADDASRRTIGLAKQSDKARAAEVNAKGQYDEVKDKLSFQQRDREIALADKRIDKQIASTENQALRFELTNRRDSLKTALNEVNDMLKSEQASMNPDPAKITALQSKFDAAYNALYSLAMQPPGGQPAGSAAASGNRPPLDGFYNKK